MESGLAVRAQLFRDKIQNVTKQVIFSALAVWLHGALFFLLTTSIFHGSHGSKVASGMNLQGLPPIIVSLNKIPAIAPATVPPPVTPVPIAPVNAPTLPLPAVMPVLPKEQPDPITDPLPTTKTKPEATPAQTNPANDNVAGNGTPNDGFLGCNSLTKPPERIIFGEDEVLFGPDDKLGYATVDEIINREGTVINASILESTYSTKVQDQIIAWSYRKFYRPGEIGGVAVDCERIYKVIPK